MEYKEIFPGTYIPVLGIGTWGMGGMEEPDTSTDDRDIAAIKKALDLGLKHIDTAEFYGGGHSEELVGEAIQNFEREKLFLTTKVWRTNLRYDDLLTSIQQSLERLSTDYVDLYLIHWPNEKIPLRETMKALEKCVENGWTRLIGVSNFGVELMIEAQSHLENEKLVANQVHYSLLHQEPKKALLPYLILESSILVAYRPIARGDLSREGNKILDELCVKYGKTQIQVTLNWLISQDNVIAIPKSSNTEHLVEIAGSVGWRLQEKDLELLSEAFQ